MILVDYNSWEAEYSLNVAPPMGLGISMNLKTAETMLETKLTLLQITAKRTEATLQAGQPDAIERQQRALKAVVAEADQWQRALEEQKIVAKQDLDEISEWNTGVDAKLIEANGEVKRLKEWLENRVRKQEMKERDEQIRHDTKLHETRMEFQTELQNAKKDAQPESKVPTTSESSTMRGIQARLPKLVITKFDGTSMDWQRFWGQFEETIDKTSIASITKFAYLRKLLSHKVKKTVEALPLTIDGYNRAKSILKSTYGKESEVVKAYVKEIVELPQIPNVNVKRIHEFGEKLMYSVQALETMNKLKQVEGNVAMTLDKLPAIRGDLVRTDPDWENWDFGKLAEALRQWTRRNPIDNKASDEQETKRRDLSNKFYHALQHKAKGCVYCDDVNHKAVGCTKVKSASDRRQILAKRRLCFKHKQVF